MNKSLPDKWIRKAIFALVDEIEVDSETIYVYDTRVVYPDVQRLTGESTDPKVDIYLNRWQVSRDQLRQSHLLQEYLFWLPAKPGT